MRRLLATTLIFAAAALAQKYEAGVYGGGGFLGQSGLPSASSVKAGLESGLAAGAFLGQNLYSSLSGEVRYEFQQRPLRLSSGGTSASLPARAHSLQYDLIYHVGSTRQKTRPYVVAGGGFKLFQGTGAEAAYRPLMDYAYLSKTQEWKPMIAAGAGVKVALGRKGYLRFEVRDQISKFPGKLIAPAPGATLPGWLHDIVPSAGIGWQF